MTLNRMMFVVVLASLSGAVAMAAPIERVFDRVSEATGRDRERVREDAIETLRHDGRFSEEELARIGARGADVERPLIERAMQSLRESGNFELDTRITALRAAHIEKGAVLAFAEMAHKPAAAAKSTNARIVKAIWQAESDAVISTGRVDAQAFKTRTNKDLETELPRESEARLAMEIGSDERVGKILKMNTKVLAYGPGVDRELAHAINAANDYAPQNRAPAKATIARLRATLERLGMKTSDVLCIVTTAEAQEKVQPGEDASTRKFWHFLIVDKTTGQGLQLVAVQGSM